MKTSLCPRLFREDDQQLINPNLQNIVFIDEVETLITKLTSRPKLKAEMLMSVNAEAEGRGINKRLMSIPSQ